MWPGDIAVRYLLIVILLAVAKSAAAQGAGWEVSEEEWNLLPEYCHHQQLMATLSGRKFSQEPWADRLGEDYIHIHHWCMTYIWQMRAYKAGINTPKGRALLVRAEGDTYYLLKNGRGDSSPFACEGYTRIEEVNLLLGDTNKAKTAFGKATKINPRMWKAWFLMGRYLYRHGSVAEAKAVVEEGLKNVPDNPSLKSLLEEIDAKKERR